MGIAETALYLSGCALNGKIPEESQLEGVNFEELYRFSESHMIPAVVDYALESAGIKHRLFTQARAKAQRKAVILGNDLRIISESLEAAGIWHMPMKGAVMKNYYPAFGLREMNDIDIFFDMSHANDVRKIMTGLGFAVEDYCNHNHDVYRKPPLTDVEMHRGLMETWLNSALGDYYYDARDKMILDDGKKYTYHFSNEDFYLYMTSHSYRHYSEGGMGLRALIDEYVYMKKFSDSLDWEYISGETVKMNLADFERDLRNLALYLFGGDESHEVNREMLKYIIESGSYGYVETEAEHVINGFFGGSRLRYLLGQVFIPLRQLKYFNPHIYRHKYLYPFFVLKRLFKAATSSRKMVIKKLFSIFRRKS